MPKKSISRLIQRGQTFQKNANQELSTFIHSKEAAFLGSVLVTKFAPPGYKKALRDLGRSGQKTSKQIVNDKWRQAGDQFLSDCIKLIGQISINTKSLTISGNSSKLCQKFNRVRRIKDAIKFYEAVIIVLTEIQALDLIWNRDISKELMHRKELAQQERVEKAKLQAESKAIVRLAKTVDLFDKLSIAQSLKQYPTVHQSILGAIDRLQTIDPDAERHCITSCRTSIELLCMNLGQSNNWKEGMSKILPSNTDQSQVKGVHHFLSGKGAHGGHTPTKKEAEYCLQLTIATLEFITNKKAN